ncbi:CHY zinc finger protein [Rossellomorea vietnamensis]|uniref:CHY zinc finger protein n=1 Tax=Rossellomorea vietnamensis TaxID=218284 RepID=UPI00077CDB00|nr:CHY zinc finger protein [Rossellomorea vietnamensis]
MTEKLIPVSGVEVDAKTKCKHYRTPKDIIAIKFKCCNTYYPCHSCHEEVADHDSILWSPEEWNTKAILCGECHNELTILQYMNCQSVCPHCQSAFNPGCQTHYHLYFEG